MKKLNKAQLARRQELVTRIEEAASLLDSLIQEANDFREEVYDSMQEYYDDRSDNWRDNENGQNYESWMSEWENEFESVECEVASLLEALPEEPN